MTDEERLDMVENHLKRITNELISDGEISEFQLRNIKWLVRQAERGQWLKYQNDKLVAGIYFNNEEYGKIVMENQRYKQALEFYADKDNFIKFHDLMRNRKVTMVLEDGGDKARQALEGVE